MLRLPLSAFAWFVGVLPGVGFGASLARPNILYVFADDQSYRSIGCYGNKAWSWVRTPNIDQLAADGVRFEHAFAGSWCVPSRATMLTGLQPHGVPGFRPAKREFDPAACRFWPEKLRRTGYTTAFIGKWHIKGYGEQRLWSRDWDHWVAWDHTREGNGGYYGEKSKDGAQLLNRDGRDERVSGYPTDNYTRFAIDFIKRRADQRQPWYLWLCYGASHAPYLAPERHRDRYPGVPVPVPADVFGPRPDKPGVMRDFTMFSREANPGGSPRYETDYLNASLEECVRIQNRTTCAVDEGVGQIIAALRETKQLENTVVVYASDNGFPWGEQGFANKNGPYDACQRTPLIIRWPARFARGAVCARPVGQIDLVPTFLALAGVDAPWEMHGHDLGPLLKDPKAAWPHPVLLEYFNEEFGSDSALPTPEKTKRAQPWDPPGWWISLRHDRYNYIRWIVADEIEELYDLDADPQQLQNLAVDRKHRRTLEDFRARTEAELRRTRAGIVERLPDVRTALHHE
jgi:arylsulfatase A-like enzyme